MTVDLCQRVLDDCSYGLYIITSCTKDGKLNGQISDALMQVTAFPAQAAVCINKTELTHDYITESGVFAASILKKTADLPFIGLFGFKSGRDIDKLSQAKHKIGKTGAPLILENVTAVFEVKVSKEIDLGTHTMFIGDVVNAEHLDDTGEVMTYDFYKTGLQGKASMNSPSYSENEPKKASSGGSGNYVCDVCGYVYSPTEGDPSSDVPAGTSFEDVPESWLCPICAVGKDEFSAE